MFAWLRDTFVNTSSSPSSPHSHSMIPSHFLGEQQKHSPKEQQRSYRLQQDFPKGNPTFPRSDDDDEEETEDESNDNSFYHNPYHSSGLMNYTHVPQQQYTNERTYPTYLAQRQSPEQLRNQSIDEQIHQKLFLLQQRGSRLQSCSPAQHDLAHRISSTSNESQGRRTGVDQQVEQEQRQEGKKKEEDDEGEAEKDRQKPVDVNDVDDDCGIRAYYPGEYPHSNEQFDLASVALWYQNVMRSVKKYM